MVARESVYEVARSRNVASVEPPFRSSLLGPQFLAGSRRPRTILKKATSQAAAAVREQSAALRFAVIRCRALAPTNRH